MKPQNKFRILPIQKKDQPVEGKGDRRVFSKGSTGSFRWPKPNAEASRQPPWRPSNACRVAARQHETWRRPVMRTKRTTPAQPAEARCLQALVFCVWCGVPNQAVAGDVNGSVSILCRSPSTNHHPLPSSCFPALERHPARPLPIPNPLLPRGRAPGSAGMSTGGRAEASARRVVQDWAHACNTRHIDDLLELYAADATLIRSSVPPVRSLPAIREFFISLLEAGWATLKWNHAPRSDGPRFALDSAVGKWLGVRRHGKRRKKPGKYLVARAPARRHRGRS